MDPTLNLPPIDVDRTIRNATDSETLIRELVADNQYSQDICNTIKRNVEHLRIISSKQEIIDSKSPKFTDFQDAIALGEIFINNQPQ